MSYLKEALEIVNDRDPLKEAYVKEVNPSLEEAVEQLLSFKNSIKENQDRVGRPSTPQNKELKDILTPQEITLAKKLAGGSSGDLMQDHKELYDKLYDFFVHIMPVGTAKARTGDPDQWILDHLEDYL